MKLSSSRTSSSAPASTRRNHRHSSRSGRSRATVRPAPTTANSSRRSTTLSLRSHRTASSCRRRRCAPMAISTRPTASSCLPAAHRPSRSATRLMSSARSTSSSASRNSPIIPSSLSTARPTRCRQLSCSTIWCLRPTRIRRAAPSSSSAMKACSCRSSAAWSADPTSVSTATRSPRRTSLPATTGRSASPASSTPDFRIPRSPCGTAIPKSSNSIPTSSGYPTR